MKNSFKPCATCSLPCKYAKAKPPENQTAMERLILEQTIKEKGCPYKKM